MSRIGRQPISIPASVTVNIEADNVTTRGPKGILRWKLPPTIEANLQQDTVRVTRQGDDEQSKSLHGLSRALIFNMVRGVSDGFVRKLEIQGVGFKASLVEKTLSMSLGYSHIIQYPIPDQIRVTVEDNTKITVEGPDKALVGKIASELRSHYPPEPYKGKGVRYAGERVERKEGKTVQ